MASRRVSRAPWDPGSTPSPYVGGGREKREAITTQLGEYHSQTPLAHSPYPSLDNLHSYFATLDPTAHRAPPHHNLLSSHCALGVTGEHRRDVIEARVAGVAFIHLQPHTTHSIPPRSFRQHTILSSFLVPFPSLPLFPPHAPHVYRRRCTHPSRSPSQGPQHHRPRCCQGWRARTHFQSRR